jgi:hypothetical protein
MTLDADSRRWIIGWIGRFSMAIVLALRGDAPYMRDKLKEIIDDFEQVEEEVKR